MKSLSTFRQVPRLRRSLQLSTDSPKRSAGGRPHSKDGKPRGYRRIRGLSRQGQVLDIRGWLPPRLPGSDRSFCDYKSVSALQFCRSEAGPAKASDAQKCAKLPVLVGGTPVVPNLPPLLPIKNSAAVAGVPMRAQFSQDRTTRCLVDRNPSSAWISARARSKPSSSSRPARPTKSSRSAARPFRPTASSTARSSTVPLSSMPSDVCSTG